MPGCVVAEAYRWAADHLDWLGVPKQPHRVRGFAAARLRYASLVRPEASSGLITLARAIEHEESSPCRACSCGNTMVWGIG